jgi:YfiH family protein
MNTDKHGLKISDGAVDSASRYLLIPALERSGRLLHAFTTRKDGLGARNNGVKGPDDWRQVAEDFGISVDRLITVTQVHGDRIITISGPAPTIRDYISVEADGMITDVPGIAVGVETADCVPVLLYDPKRPAVAAVHAGWRSTVRRIVQKAAGRMHDEYGSDPAGMIAAIGPAIGPECYEVDEPVIGSLKAAIPFWEDVTARRGEGRWGLDLVSLNRLQLVESGLKAANVYSVGMCTSCRKDLFYSFRAEGRTGRMLSVIMIKP